MNALTASVDDAAVDYVHQPVNFGEDAWGVRTAEVDAFRAGAEWAQKHIDWRVLARAVPGHVMADRLRLGDRVIEVDIEGVIVGLSAEHGRVHFTVCTERGAQIAFERPEVFPVMVLDVGRSA